MKALLHHRNQRLLQWTWINLNHEAYLSDTRSSCTAGSYQHLKHSCNDPCSCSIRWVCQVLYKAQKSLPLECFLVTVFKLETVPSHRLFKLEMIIHTPCEKASGPESRTAECCWSPSLEGTGWVKNRRRLDHYRVAFVLHLVSDKFNAVMDWSDR